MDPALHKQFTAHTNERILKNLATVAETVRAPNGAGAPDGKHALTLWIRTPLIPEATATPENIEAIGRYIGEHLADVVERWELCAFNSACKQKYDKLGKDWRYADCPLMDQHEIDALKVVALAAGTPPETLVVSGLIAKPEK